METINGMRVYTKDELKVIIEEHNKWVFGEGGARADLRCADLRYADLRSADLRYADLRYANLTCADLRSADLTYADLRSALRQAEERQEAQGKAARIAEATEEFTQAAKTYIEDFGPDYVGSPKWNAMKGAYKNLREAEDKES